MSSEAEDNRIKEMIERRLSREGWDAKSWREGEDGLEAVIGRFRVIEEVEDDGLYEGDEGELSACVVGSLKYHNESVAFGFTIDDYDSHNTVRDLSVLDPI